MPRPRHDAKQLHATVSSLVAAMQGLLKTLGAVPIGGVALPPELKRPKGGTRGRNAKLRSVWANYTPAQRKARIAAMRAGHARRKRNAQLRGATR